MGPPLTIKGVLLDRGESSSDNSSSNSEGKGFELVTSLPCHMPQNSSWLNFAMNLSQLTTKNSKLLDSAQVAGLESS